jgi:RNA polymerase primary sigma factor
MAPQDGMIGRRRSPADVWPHPGAPAPVSPAADAEVDHWLRGRGAPSPAVELSAAETANLQDTASVRARRLLEVRLAFIGHPSFGDAPAVAGILGPAPAPDGGKGSLSEPAPGVSRPPGAVSGRGRLLTREQEVHLFRKMNFLKYAAARLREAIDPDTAVNAEIDRVEILIREAAAILDRIIGSNLALVVFIAKKYARTGEDFSDLVSDGNLSLLRAAERFDFARGFRFSTYASWTISNNFARRFRREKARYTRFVTGRPELFRSLADPRGGEPLQAARPERSSEAVRSLLGHLSAREQTIIKGRFGLTDKKRTLVELGRELGISRERVRQIETRALRKLWDTDEARSLARADWGT